MTRRNIKRINKLFCDYLTRRFGHVKVGDMEDSIVLSEDGEIINLTYFLPYQLAFSEEGGQPLLTTSVRFSSASLVKAIQEEYAGVEKHLKLLDEIKHASPSARELDRGTYFGHRNIVENGEYVRVVVAVKTFPRNLNDLFDYAFTNVIQPTMRAIDDIRVRRF